MGTSSATIRRPSIYRPPKRPTRSGPSKTDLENQRLKAELERQRREKERLKREKEKEDRIRREEERRRQEEERRKLEKDRQRLEAWRLDRKRLEDLKKKKAGESKVNKRVNRINRICTYAAIAKKRQDRKRGRRKVGRRAPRIRKSRLSQGFGGGDF